MKVWMKDEKIERLYREGIEPLGHAFPLFIDQVFWIFHFPFTNHYKATKRKSINMPIHM